VSAAVYVDISISVDVTGYLIRHLEDVIVVVIVTLGRQRTRRQLHHLSVWNRQLYSFRFQSPTAVGVTAACATSSAAAFVVCGQFLFRWCPLPADAVRPEQGQPTSSADDRNYQIKSSPDGEQRTAAVDTGVMLLIAETDAFVALGDNY
jgi:hypothetical protein